MPGPFVYKLSQPCNSHPSYQNSRYDASYCKRANPADPWPEALRGWFRVRVAADVVRIRIGVEAILIRPDNHYPVSDLRAVQGGAVRDARLIARMTVRARYDRIDRELLGRDYGCHRRSRVSRTTESRLPTSPCGGHDKGERAKGGSDQPAQHVSPPE